MNHKLDERIDKDELFGKMVAESCKNMTAYQELLAKKDVLFEIQEANFRRQPGPPTPNTSNKDLSTQTTTQSSNCDYLTKCDECIFEQY